MDNKYPPLGLGDVIRFGKHKDTEMSDLIINKPGYIQYMMSEGIIQLTDEAFELYKEHEPA